MTCIYCGKTKDAHAHPNGWLLRFKDSVLGRNGQPDPGGNAVIGSEPGRGIACLTVAVWTFHELQRAGMPTHFIRATPDGILVQPTERIPLEVIARNFAAGSFLARYGARVAPNAPLGGLVELTLKDDAADDPLLTAETALALGLATAPELAAIDRLARDANRALTAAFAARNLTLIDCKMEFGRQAGTRALLLIDDIGANSLRVRRDGDILGAQAIAAALA